MPASLLLRPEQLAPGGCQQRPCVQIEVLRWFDNLQHRSAPLEKVAQAVAPRPAGRVGVDHRNDSLINGSGAIDQNVSYSIIRRLGSEDADRGVAGACGGECVGDAFGDEQHSWACVAVGCAGPGEAWVGAEAAGGVVVLVGSDRLEVAGLDVLDVALGIERREGGGEGVAVGEASSAGHHRSAGVGTDVVGPEEVVVEAAGVEPVAHRSSGVSPQDLLAGVDVADHRWIEGDHARPGTLRFASCGWERLIRDHPGAVGEPCDGVGTVDAFQGKEFDVVFLSIVRANDVVVPDQKEGEERERLLNGKYGHLRLANRMNVAMSRQRKLLVAVGAKHMAEGPESEEGVPALAAFLKLCREEMAHGR